MRKMIAAALAACLFVGPALADGVTPEATPPAACTNPVADVLAKVDSLNASDESLKGTLSVTKYEGDDYKMFVKGVMAVLPNTDPSLFDQFDAVYVVASAGQPGVLVLLAKGGCVVTTAQLPNDVYGMITAVVATIKAQS